MRFIDILKINTPGSYMLMMRNMIGEPETMLDLGCGEGALTEILSYGKEWKITGADIHKPSIKRAKEKGLYVELYQGDILKIVKKLVRQKKKYDVVFFSQVIEHIGKKDGLEILKLLDKLAKKKIIIGTPRGFMVQPEEFIDNNPYQHHKSGWEQKEFEDRGYKVYGVGLAPIWSEKGLGRLENKLFRAFVTIIAYVFSPVVYRYPKLGAGIIAVKVI